MNLEFDALLKNCRCTLVPPPPAVNVICCKWVFHIKRHADGAVELFKARLVFKGFHQQPGIDFGETFSPVIKPIMVRTIYPLLFLRSGLYTKLMFKMHSYMGNYLKMFLWLNPWVLHIPSIVIIYVNLKKPCMVSNRLQEHGSLA
jgi:hypothetical protein